LSFMVILEVQQLIDVELRSTLKILITNLSYRNLIKLSGRLDISSKL